jgi:putative hemolysin
MNTIALEIAIVAVLLVANGIFAMTEMALVSSRKSRLRSRAEKGDRGAVAALDLAESPTRFLSTVQLGITLIGIFAGAFGGATLAHEIGDKIDGIPVLGVYSDHIGFGLVVLALTFFSLVIGELVPKRLALQNPERISVFMARPMQSLSRIAAPIVHVLSASTEMILRIFRIHAHKETPVTEEEVAGMVREGLEAGVLHPAESEMMHSVLALDRLNVRQIMTQRPRIVWLSADDTHEEIWHKIVVSHHSHFPVYEGRRDQVLGVVSVKSIYANLAAGISVNLRDLLVPALVIPQMQSAIALLETLKRESRHIALATDEYGGISGLVTLNDLLEAIVGEMPEAGSRRALPFVAREDGSVLVDALVGIEEVEAYFSDFALSEAEQRKYSTLGGYICERLGRIPSEGEHFEDRGFRFEVLDMDRQRVDKVLVSQLPVRTEELLTQPRA